MAMVVKVSFVHDYVRRHDPDRYYTTLFAPDEKRQDLLALYAFNLEIAKIRESVSEPFLGQIRLAWWREAVEGIFEHKPRDHAVIEALATAVERRSLPRAALDALIDAREFDLEDRSIDSLQELVGYAQRTSGALVELALAILSPQVAPKTLERGRALGIAWALTGLVRAAPFHARTGRQFISTQLTQTVAPGSAAGAPASDSIPLILAEAEAQLHKARDNFNQLTRTALPVFLLAPICANYLDLLKRAGGQPAGVNYNRGKAWRQLLVLYAYLRGTI